MGRGASAEQGSAAAAQTRSPQPIGEWSGGRFHFNSGFGLGDGQFVCPYGPHLVDMADEIEAEDFAEGYCEVCRRNVDIDTTPVPSSPARPSAPADGAAAPVLCLPG